MNDPLSSERISGYSIVQCGEDQVSCDLNGEAAILQLSSGLYFGLNEVGARVWELITDPIRVNDLKDVLLGEFEIDEATCEADLFELLVEMAEAGLIEVKEDHE